MKNPKRYIQVRHETINFSCGFVDANKEREGNVCVRMSCDAVLHRCEFY